MTATERGSFNQNLVETIKKLDYVLITAGAGIYILFQKTVGLALIIGGTLVLTAFPKANN